MKTCQSCKLTKEDNLFNKDSKYNNDYVQCKACKNIINKRHYHKHKEYYHSHALRKYTYKGQIMTGEIYRMLVEQQGGHCALCPNVPEERIRSNGAVVPAGRFEVDHDHVTKEVRGLLCPECNKKLSGMNKDEETLQFLSKVKDYIFND